MRRCLFFLVCLAFDLEAAVCSRPNPDVNRDRSVDKFDELAIARSFKLSSKDPRYNWKADANCDGRIDAADIGFVRKFVDAPKRLKEELPTIGSTRLRRYSKQPLTPKTVVASPKPIVPHYPLTLTFEKIKNGIPAPFSAFIAYVTVDKTQQAAFDAVFVQDDQSAMLWPLKKYAADRYRGVLLFNRASQAACYTLSAFALEKQRLASAPQRLCPETYNKSLPNAVLSLVILSTTLTRLPDPSVDVEVNVLGGLSDMIEQLTIRSRNRQFHWPIWQTPEPRSTRYRTRLDLRGAKYGQCLEFEVVAKLEGGITLVRQFMQPLYVADASGRIAAPAFKAITHDVPVR